MANKKTLTESFNNMIDKLLVNGKSDDSKKQIINNEIKKIEGLKRTLSFNDIVNAYKSNIQFYDLYIRCLTLRAKKLNINNKEIEK